MLCRKIIKGQQAVTILLQALDCFRIFCFVCCNKTLKIAFGFAFIIGLPDLMQVRFGF